MRSARRSRIIATSIHDNNVLTAMVEENRQTDYEATLRFGERQVAGRRVCSRVRRRVL